MAFELLAHRGFWNETRPKNSISAFTAAFDQGYGVETDVRDYNGALVISHDIPGPGLQSFDDFLTLYKQCGAPSFLAINIKADGLQTLLHDALTHAGIQNYFVFDASVPDGLLYLRKNMTFFTRQSEFEITPSFYNESAGIWIDEFDGHWVTEAHLKAHYAQGKVVSLVSPELHKRPHEREWADYRQWVATNQWDSLMLCTDYPDQAQTFFGIV